MNLKKIPWGEIDGVPVFTKFKGVMIELFKGYPAYRYFGIFESYFGRDLGKRIVKILEDDDLLEVVSLENGNEPTQYRLTGNGINMAISMINLNYSEKMHTFTIWIIVLTILTVIPTLIQLSPYILRFMQHLF